MDKSSGVTDEVLMLRDQLCSRDKALTLANSELEAVRRQIEQLNKKYQTALQKYDNTQQWVVRCCIVPVERPPLPGHFSSDIPPATPLLKHKKIIY